MSGRQTDLQLVWVDLLDTIRLARLHLDAAEFETFVALLVILVARLGREQLEREMRRAA